MLLCNFALLQASDSESEFITSSTSSAENLNNDPRFNAYMQNIETRLKKRFMQQLEAEILVCLLGYLNIQDHIKTLENLKINDMSNDEKKEKILTITNTFGYKRSSEEKIHKILHDDNVSSHQSTTSDESIKKCIHEMLSNYNQDLRELDNRYSFSPEETNTAAAEMMGIQKMNEIKVVVHDAHEGPTAGQRGQVTMVNALEGAPGRQRSLMNPIAQATDTQATPQKNDNMYTSNDID